MQSLDPSPWGWRWQPRQIPGTTPGDTGWVLGVSQEEPTRACPFQPCMPSESPPPCPSPGHACGHRPRPSSSPQGFLLLYTAELPEGKDRANPQERGWGDTQRCNPSKSVTGTVWSRLMVAPGGDREENQFQIGCLGWGEPSPPRDSSGHLGTASPGHEAAPKGASCPFLPRAPEPGGGQEGLEGRAGSPPPASSGC